MERAAAYPRNGKQAFLFGISESTRAFAHIDLVALNAKVEGARREYFIVNAFQRGLGKDAKRLEAGCRNFRISQFKFADELTRKYAKSGIC